MMEEIKLLVLLGMDPAAPLFQEQDESMTISPSSGTFVDIIHSNAGDMTEVSSYTD